MVRGQPETAQSYSELLKPSKEERRQQEFENGMVRLPEEEGKEEEKTEKELEEITARTIEGLMNSSGSSYEGVDEDLM